MSVRATPVTPLAWLVAPTAAVLAATLVFAVPVRVLGLQLPEPVFALAPAFAWAMARPSIAPPLVLLGLGVCLDLIWGGPLGLWPLCLLAAYGAVFAARRVLAGQDVWVLWGAYAAACALAFTLGEALTAAHAGRTPSLAGVGLQMLVTWALFPFAWKMLERYEAPDARF